jgi:hypothetical protein
MQTKATPPAPNATNQTADKNSTRDFLISTLE